MGLVMSNITLEGLNTIKKPSLTTNTKPGSAANPQSDADKKAKTRRYLLWGGLGVVALTITVLVIRKVTK